MTRITIFNLFILLGAFATTVEAASIFTTTDKRISLLELYTSEGCSSCPPADRWLSKLKDDDRLWKKFIPVAFHVDYWNYIGWDDRFSSPDYSQRQRNYARARNLKTVYTPGFLLNGEEWRSFFGLRRLSPAFSESVGVLTLKIENQHMEASYVPVNIDDHQLKLNIAIVGFELTTDVKAGENKGKKLNHDFVVLAYDSVFMNQSTEGYSVSTGLPEISIIAPRYGIVAWVSNINDQTPIQTVGGMLEKE